MKVNCFPIYFQWISGIKSYKHDTIYISIHRNKIDVNLTDYAQYLYEESYKTLEIPGGSVVKTPPPNAGDKGSIPGSGI